LVVLDELVIHGWDVAVASGVDYRVPDEEVQAATGFVSSLDAPRDGSLFGPVVPDDRLVSGSRANSAGAPPDRRRALLLTQRWFPFGQCRS